MFLMFFYIIFKMFFFSFKKCFVLFLMLRFCSYKNINVQNYKYDAFLMGKLRLVLFLIYTTITITNFLVLSRA